VVQPLIAGRVVTSVSVGGVPALVTTGYFLFVQRALLWIGSTRNTIFRAAVRSTHVLPGQAVSAD